VRELSMHIMDIAENSIAAGAGYIQIEVEEDSRNNLFQITITDDGRGMPEDFLERVTDPFVTSRSTRCVGLGLSLLKEAALRCNGRFRVDSKPGKGTRVEGVFEYRHIDRAPLGDMPGSIAALIFGNSGVDFYYRHLVDGKEFSLDTRELRSAEVSLEDTKIIKRLSLRIQEGLDGLSSHKTASFFDGEKNGQTHNR